MTAVTPKACLIGNFPLPWLKRIWYGEKNNNTEVDLIHTVYEGSGITIETTTKKNTKQFNIQPGDTLHGGCVTIDAILFNAVCNKPALFQNKNKMLKKSLSWQIG